MDLKGWFFLNNVAGKTYWCNLERHYVLDAGIFQAKVLDSEPVIQDVQFRI